MGYITVNKCSQYTGHYILATSDGKISWEVAESLVFRALNLLKNATRSIYVLGELKVNSDQLQTIRGTKNTKFIETVDQYDLNEHSFDYLKSSVSAAVKTIHEKRKERTKEDLVFAIIALAFISFSSFSFYFGIAGTAVAALTILDSMCTRYIYSEGSQYSVKFNKSVTDEDIRYITTIDMQRYAGRDVSYQGAQGAEEEDVGASSDIAAEAAEEAAAVAAAAAGGKQWWKKS